MGWPATSTLAAGGQAAQLILDGLSYVHDVDTSGDGRTVVVSGRMQSGYGLWAVDVETGRVTQLSTGLYPALTLAPDGKTVAVFTPRTDSDDVIRFIDLPT